MVIRFKFFSILFLFSFSVGSSQVDTSSIKKDFNLDDETQEKLISNENKFHDEDFSFLKEGKSYNPKFLVDEVKDNKEKDTQEVIDNLEYKILLSESMGFERVKGLIKSLSYRDDVSFYFKGMLKSDKNIGDPFNRVARIVKDLNETPAIYIDPRPFREVDATAVPIISAYLDDKLISFARGTANPVFIQESIKEGKLGDLGVVGDVYQISEIELIEMISQRWEKLDKEKIISEVKDSYWENAIFIELPYAYQDKVRRFKPIISVKNDIVGENNKVVIKKGTLINTLEMKSFNKRLVFFDATDDKQIDFVKKLPNFSQPTTLITTSFNRELKSSAIKDIEAKVGAPVYLLNKDLLIAFDLEVVPSVVTADNKSKEFVIEEYMP